MFGNKKNNDLSYPKVESLINRGTRIEGNVYFSGGLLVDGEICGQVIATNEEAALTLSEHGNIHGQVDVPKLSVNGTIRGPVRASEHLWMQSRARIEGDVTYSQIVIELGAVIEGRMLLGQDAAGNARVTTRTDGGKEEVDDSPAMLA
ncbi:MAG: polymer-forming cytoskeletal protein [Zoogloeaceae bacterium]|jgi:cytoskeletal protein CcmA (bactofilin family)|nr:polymer-forming cytoskeletal protein [Zoogloeaceae bacterium]